MTPRQAVERERLRVHRLHVAAGVALCVAATAVVLALGVVALGDARWLALPRPVPLLVWLVALAANVVVVRWTLRRLRREATSAEVAAAIEREQSLRAGQLRGVLEVEDSGALARRAAETVGARLASAGPALAPGLQRRTRSRTVRGVVAALATLALFGWAAPAFDDGLLALLRPVSAWRGTLLPALGFDALPPAVVRSEPLRVRVVAPGRERVRLHARATGEGWRALDVVVPAGARVVEVPLGPVTGDVSLVVDDGRATSDTAVVRVADRPFLGGVVLLARYPRYLGRPDEGLALGEPARVPRGTVIQVTGRASTALSRVRLAAPGDTVALLANAHAFSGRLLAERAGRFAWLADGAAGAIADVPPPIELVVVPDSAPRVALLQPLTDTVAAADGAVALQATASDDHGVASVQLESWRVTAAGVRTPTVVERVSSARSTEWAGQLALSLAGRGLEPGDALHARVVATDDSPWAQRGASRELVVRVPTLEERRSLARDAADSAVASARALAQAQKSLAQRTDEAARERGQRGTEQSKASESSGARGATSGEPPKDAMSFQSAEKAQGIAKDQREVAQKTEQLRQAAQALEKQLGEAGALDSALSRQLREVQQLLKDSMTPEMMAQMQKLEDASRNLQGDQARQAMRELQQMQQRMREMLEKSAEMLRRAALEGAMETLHDEAKDVAQAERSLADSAGAKGDRADDEARRLAQRSDRLADDMAALQKRLQQEKAQPGARQADEARQRAEASERAMRRAADAMQKEEQPSAASPRPSAESQGGQRERQNQQGQQSQRGQQAEGRGQKSEGQPQKADGRQQKDAREAAEQMDKAAQAMKDAREEQVAEWKQELTKELDRSIQEMLQMAREQGALEQKARGGQSSAEQMRGAQSSLQQGVEQTGARLDQAGKKSSLLSGRSQRAMGEAQQKVKQATQQLSQEKGSGQGAAGAMAEAAEALNRAAASLARDREKANSSNSATGFAEMMQQLQEMAQKQAGINGQAQGLMQMPGGPMSPGAQATGRQLARQQRQVAEQLDELSENAAGQRAGELAKEAKAAADALDGGRLDASTLARQQQLYRKLLDAGRALEKEEREDEQKREATAARGGDPFAPGAGSASDKAAARFREPTWNELRGLSPEERRAILDYFRRINGQKP